jgi:hypothetical protein
MGLFFVSNRRYEALREVNDYNRDMREAYREERGEWMSRAFAESDMKVKLSIENAMLKAAVAEVRAKLNLVAPPIPENAGH